MNYDYSQLFGRVRKLISTGQFIVGLNMIEQKGMTFDHDFC